MIAQWPKELFSKLPERTTKDVLSALRYSNGERNFKDVMNELMSGEKQIWVHTTDDKFNATVSTEVIDFPGKRTCMISYLGGDHILDCLDDIGTIELWAKENGCKDIQVIGRKGWCKALKKFMYNERYTVIGKEL